MHASEEEKKERNWLKSEVVGLPNNLNPLEAFTPVEKLVLEWEIAGNSDGGTVSFSVSWALLESDCN